MNGFARNIEAARDRSYDLIVIGGGIYGMTLTLEAARRGLRPLLVERDDFGGATSLNSLRILHGGLRYLQSANLPRFFESVQQRGWFMKHFGPLCRELPCMMPLYGAGLKRPSIFRVALGINRVLSGRSPMGRGRVLSARDTAELFPGVCREVLRGGALWHNGQILSPQRLHAELLHWAVARGATVLNYAEALELMTEGNRVRGLATSCGSFEAPVVINTAGPWAPEVAARLDRPFSDLMTPSLTFNVLLEVEPPSEVAVEAARVYFVTPHRSGMTFVGTIHKTWEGRREANEEDIEEFLADLKRAVPGWEIDRSHVRRVTPGVLPAMGPGKADMAHRSTFVAHEVEGLFSSCGIKYTTAQRFALKVLERVFGKGRSDDSRPELSERARYVEPENVMALGGEALRELMKAEAVTKVDDLLERRMDWISDPAEEKAFAERVEGLLAGTVAH